MASMRAKKRQRRRLVETAYHEAGHAVACMTLKRPFKRVTIVPEGDSLGHILKRNCPKSIRPDIVVNCRSFRWIEREIICALAGLAAEHRFAGRHNWRGAGSDFSHAVDLAGNLYFEPAVSSRYLAFMVEQAKCLVAASRVWIEIQAIAAALMERETLSAREAKQVIRDETPHGRKLAELDRRVIEAFKK
jgi:ATP-dependent Zn protease